MKNILLSVLAIILLVEEWLWDTLVKVGKYLFKKLHLARLEYWLVHCSPNQALLAISLPILFVTPLNIAALWLLSQGLISQAIGLEIIAKLVGTLFIARFFSLSKQQLLTFPLINAVYTTITSWLDWAKEKVVNTQSYQTIKSVSRAIKAKAKAWFYGK